MGNRLRSGTTVVALALGLVLAPQWSPASAATRASVLTAAASYARSQGFHIGIAVFDTRTGETYGGGDATGSFASESIVKAMIATRLLVQGRMTGSTAHRAWKMITQSDDGIASSFYNSVGGDGLITWIKRRYHVPDLGSPPSSPGWWGNTHITPRGLVTYYARVKRDPRVGPWLIKAMHHAQPYGSDGTYQFFGLPSATTGAAVKQGWGCDFASGCDSADFNTSGYVNHERYTVAILARGPRHTYGSAIASMLTRTARILLPGGRFPDPRPTARELTRLTGRTSGGQRVGVYGSDFTGVQKVLFGRIPGSALTVHGPHFLSVTTPAHVPGRFVLRVVTSHGTSAGTVSFTFVAPPSISAVSPPSGPAAGGAQVTVTGRNLASVTKVNFGGIPATGLVHVSPTTLTVIAPAHELGTARVVAVSPFGRSPAEPAAVFTYTD